IEEYGVAQISMNLTNVSVTPTHVAFDTCVEKAQARGIRVTGSEVVGLVPLEAMLDAGRYFLRKQKRSTGVSDRDLIHIAVKSMGLDELGPFDPDKKIIEYVLRGELGGRLVDRTVEGFTHETASESVAPGGGSVSAAVGALGAALGTMVANLSSHKRGWDERWEEFSDWAEKGKACHEELLRLVDADTDAFNEIMAAFGLPNSTDEEQAERAAAIEAATVKAIEVPYRTMEVSLQSMEVIEAMAEIGLPASASDAGVAALCVRTAVLGAYLNVLINAKELTDGERARGFVEGGAALRDEAMAREAKVLETLAEKL
ncbi:MAG: cyclodeaminase/cyclohydrolase family protein, partial [Planctomycetes bacterium]|nr:cyclodeaminase/cyclohydrolase family protein [Planctomycetota bacterium]